MSVRSGSTLSLGLGRCRRGEAGEIGSLFYAVKRHIYAPPLDQLSANAKYVHTNWWRMVRLKDFRCAKVAVTITSNKLTVVGSGTAMSANTGRWSL